MEIRLLKTLVSKLKRLLACTQLFPSAMASQNKVGGNPLKKGTIMGAIERQATSFEDTFTNSELKSVFGVVLKPLKRRFAPNVSRYMVSVGSASTGTLLSQIGLRLVKFTKRHQFGIVMLLCILSWAVTFSGWLS